MNWTIWDRRHVVTAMLQPVLTQWSSKAAVRIHLSRIAKLSDCRQQVHARYAGLSVWALWEDEFVEPLCLSIAAVAGLAEAPLRVCFVAPELGDHMGLLVEAGAQVVSWELPSLRSKLPKLLDHCRLTKHGHHPLTGGLVERLPWSQL